MGSSSSRNDLYMDNVAADAAAFVAAAVSVTNLRRGPQTPTEAPLAADFLEIPYVQAQSALH